MSLMKAEPADSFVDLFPGMGVFGRVWQQFVTQ